MNKTILLTALLALLTLPACQQRKPAAVATLASMSENTGHHHHDRHRSDSRPDSQEPAALIDVHFDGNQGLKHLRRYAYQCWYSEQLRLPMAVAWYLTADHTRGREKRREQAFHPDDDVRNPVTTFDYMQSGYDRGHMCPAGDNKWSRQALDETFLMTNICPQNHNLNTNDWNDLEQLCRAWARRYGRVYIVCGPVLRGSSHKQIGPRQRRIAVPEAFYKVVLRLGKEPAALGFVYDNHGRRQPLRQTVCTVDEVERLTGIDFFAALDDKVEQQIEAHATLGDWQPASYTR